MTKTSAQQAAQASSSDEAVLRLFQTLRREQKEEFLTYFESALKTRSWPASDHHPPEKAES